MKAIESGAWARLIATAVGLWLMAAPAVLDYSGSAELLHRILGPLAASMAIIALWETTRELRQVNALAGAVLVVAPLVLGIGGAALVNSIASGLVLIAVSRVRGRIEGRYGGGWRVLWRGGS